ncbi:MAG: MarR family winged helix-turn-helix transcriptional regulator [Oscillospiraceae bacterium]|jgi:MarR family transcriptional regulator for hemolysin|nr:MarR family winged helix-turn-helix transcriptional regulator [Oscillospiraceae bacterium]
MPNLESYQFSINFWYGVRLIKRLYKEALDEAGKALGLTGAEAAVINFLRENPEFDTARDIAALRDVSRAYVSGAVEHLVKRRYLTIRTDEEDRRLQHLVITDKCKPIAEALHQAHWDFYAKVTEGLTDEDLLNLWVIIEKCAKNLLEGDITPPNV